MYSEKEINTIKSICSNPDFVAVLKKAFVTDVETLSSDAFAKSNAELGEIVRANQLAQQKIEGRYARFLMVGQESKGKSRTVPE